MQFDIAAHIEKLLFLHDTLNIPGFGGFSATRTPAAVDYAGGAVTPPSKTLSFSENLSIDDGILVDDLVKTHSISIDEAREAIREFVQKTQEQLDQREIVTLAGVGRLYKNYVQKIQFLPDATNFHAGSYGLPPLQFSPIARSREVNEKPQTQPEPSAAAATAGTATTSTSPTKKKAKTSGTNAIPPLPAPPNFVHEPYVAPQSSAARFVTGIGIGLIICTIGFGIWWWQNNKAPENEILANAELVQDSKTPVPGSSAVPGIPDISKMAETGKQQSPAPADPESEEDQDLNDEVEEAATAKRVEVLRRQNEAPPSTIPAARSEESRKCILIVATLQNRDNADLLIAKLKGAGYNVFYRQSRGHQVGIQFYYTDSALIDQRKNELSQLTGEKYIFVKQK